ncbi:MAG: tetratricopeptide repeat protein [Verrucomicrobia bacterium]|nr:tetratricopeptide repeat protein [Verrucomicrobiota bacterium]
MAAIQTRTLGPENPATLRSRANRAGVLAMLGRAKDAAQETRAVLTLQERVLGPENPETLATCYNLARRLHEQQKHPEALSYARLAYAGHMKLLGSEHPSTQKCLRLVHQLSKPEPRTCDDDK